MTAGFHMLLMDIGSTTIKWCVALGEGRFGAVSRERRKSDVSAAQQPTAIADRYADLPLRVCSSARGGLQVGLLGLTGRYSLTAGRRAVLAAGGRLSYANQLGKTNSPAPGLLDPVDVLVLVGGIDRGDHRRLSAALAEFRPIDHPHAMLVWAGAATAALDLPVRHRVANVQNDQLQPTPDGLTTLLRQLHAGISNSGPRDLEALSSRIDGPIVATSRALGAAADQLATERQSVLVVDVGGTSTDLYYRRGGLAPAGPSPQLALPELGLAGSRAALSARIADEPLLYEFVEAIAPVDSRALYRRLRDADQAALAAPVGFLACLFASVRELGAAVRGLPDTGQEPPCASLDLADAHVVVTGGACVDVPPETIARVLDAASGRRASQRSVTVDTDYQLWARGLHRVYGPGQAARGADNTSRL